MRQFEYDAVLEGGCGQVGLPAGIALFGAGLRVVLQDISAHAVETVNGGKLPFAGPGAEDRPAQCNFFHNRSTEVH